MEKIKVSLRDCMENCIGRKWYRGSVTKVVCPPKHYEHLRGETLPLGCICVVEEGEEAPSFCRRRKCHTGE